MKTLISNPTKRKWQMTLTLLAMIIVPAGISATELPACSSTCKEEITTEAEPKLEAWMQNPNSWDVDLKKVTLIYREEEEMPIEAWMLDLSEDNWNNASEESIPLEAWMSSPESFLTDTDNQSEEEFALEDWMSSPSNWQISELAIR